VERQVPRHRAPLLAAGRRARARPRGPRRVRAPLHRVERPVPPRPAPAQRERQLHRRARRLHARRLHVYSRKHNHANGEDNRDGRDNEICANLGTEGPSDDATITALRSRVRRALLATLLLAQGTPMLNAGDEIANSQQGNNNAWNQDNPTGWLDWAHADDGLCRFVGELLACGAPSRPCATTAGSTARPHRAAS
jgi:hypothetical protein